MAPPGPQKRKQPSPPSTNRAAKRSKANKARTILTQTSDKALNKNGDLDVSAFVKAREFEIKAMGASMAGSKKALSTRAFQSVPKNLRRRTASHNVKRVPKRLRGKAAKEMKDDNTPTVTARRRKPTPHQRLRLEKAKELKRLGKLIKKRHEGVKKQKPGETDPQTLVSVAPHIPKLKKDTLSTPAKPPPRFRKRQIHKSWLPTHIYHAKRALMTPPKEPLWRFSIPLTPNDKCYRSTHRAASARSCVAWDMSYISTIGVDGVEASLLGLLRSIGVEEGMLVGKKGQKWRRGTRGLEAWVRERDGEGRWIAKVEILWCLDAEAVDNGTTIAEKKAVKDGATEQVQGGGEQNDVGNEDEIMQDAGTPPKQVFEQERKKSRRNLLLRVHPSVFFQVWNEILKVAKIQRPQAMVEDLRFEIGSIEIVGPGSTEALVGALHPVQDAQSTSRTRTKASIEDEWEDIETAERIWPQLAAVTNPGALPANAVLAFNVSDPRLHHPPRTVQLPSQDPDNAAMCEILSSWPPDQTQSTPEIFDRTRRLTASRLLASQKAINRRKGDALPGAYPAPSSRDPKIPVLLIASRAPITSHQGSWILLLPWDCVLPVWYSLMHYPSSSGGNPRFGGLREKRQIAFEQGTPWFPGDFPGTKAGFELELMERERKKREWERRPKGKRTEFDSVDLGNGKKGEIGVGWACDWERLFQGPPPPSKDTDDREASLLTSRANAVPDDNQSKPLSESKRTSNVTTDPRPSQPHPPTDPPSPPLSFHHLVAPTATTRPIPFTALAPVHLTLNAGHPTATARIYRLPTTNPDLRNRWLTIAHPQSTVKSKDNKTNNIKAARRFTGLAKITTPHDRARELAGRLLPPPTFPAAGTSTSVPHVSREGGVPKPGDKDYPCVPDEIDLIGFVTTGNYNLGEGRCEAIGNVAVAKVVGEEGGEKGRLGDRNGGLCIVRESGQYLGRVARWRFL
ncbi:hypothetical protein N7G274_004426 [Stereocaulon virgatum]|uniref:POPLD-domain-containing protein n=1 Tax=Stereocaulon virgatum TaxID=373712 RepID=A0ABR4A9V5_9LECA